MRVIAEQGTISVSRPDQICPLPRRQLMEHCIKQNNTLDMYEEYFGGEHGGAPAVEAATAAKTVNVFRDPCPTRRAVRHAPTPQTRARRDGGRGRCTHCYRDQRAVWFMSAARIALFRELTYVAREY